MKHNNHKKSSDAERKQALEYISNNLPKEVNNIFFDRDEIDMEKAKTFIAGIKKIIKNSSTMYN